MEMKICQLCAVDFTAKRFLLPLIDGMKKKGWNVHTVCSNGKYVNSMMKDGYVVKTINIPRNLNPLKIIQSIYLLFKLFKNEKYDVVHVHTPIASIIGRVASKLAGVRLIIYTAHGFYFHENMSKLKYLFYVSLEKIAGLITNILFTQSEEDKKTAIKNFFLPKHNIFCIGNGVDPDKFNPKKAVNKKVFKNSLKIPNNSFVIGIVCRIVREKGLLEFLSAAQRISKNYKNVYFIIVGERLSSDHDKNIDDKLKNVKKKLQSKLILLGDRNDIPNILSAIDLFCLPSWREGMPRSVIEAMMMKKPVLCTDIRGSRELVVNKRTGLLVPVKQDIDLEEGMKFFIKNPKICKRFGQQGRKRALKFFDERVIVKKQIKIIFDAYKNLRK